VRPGLAARAEICYYPAMDPETKYYELSYLLPATLTAEETAQKEEEIRTFLAKEGASIDSWDSPKLRRLPYLIKKQQEAYAGALRFTILRKATGTVQETLRMKPWIMRLMLLEWKKLPPRRPRPQIRKAPDEARVPTDEKALNKKLEEIFKGDPTL